jgi:hypothetical protein
MPMQSCQVCGRSFDPLRFQVVVPELGHGFDRIDCARSARALASPSSRLAGAPLVALAAPAAAAAAPAAVGGIAPVHRLLGSTAATLGLVAAGAAAAAVLWLRVVGTDTSSYTLGRLTAPPAFGHDRVQAQVEAAPTPTPPAPIKVVTVTVERVVPVQTAPTGDGGGGTGGGTVRTPLSPHESPARPATRSLDREHETGEDRPNRGESHDKHFSNGKGHEKHSPHGKGHGHDGHGEIGASGGQHGGQGHGLAKGKGKH